MSAGTVAAVDGRRLSKVIFDYARLINQEQDREKLLEVIADMGRDLVEADRCSIWLLDEATNELVTRVAHGTGVIRVKVGEGKVGRCVATSEVVMANSMESEDETSATVDARTGYRTTSVLTVPMKNMLGKTIGAFQALNKPGNFTLADADLLGLAAAYSASTIETQALQRRAEDARRMARELEIAREVQQRLLPSEFPPLSSGFDAAAACRPASEVGGDYYIFHALPRGSFLFGVGDVSGKGIAAALMMASVQASLQGLISQNFGSLAELASTLNRVVYDTSTSSRYSTLFLALYDPEASTLTTVNAGHVSPVLLRPDGSQLRFDADGPPIGLLTIARFTETTTSLAPGDTLICFSDGLTDCENPSGDLWGECGFEAAVPPLAGMVSAAIVSALMEQADRFANGAKQSDDMTVLCVRAEG